MALKIKDTQKLSNTSESLLRLSTHSCFRWHVSQQKHYGDSGETDKSENF